MGIAPFAKDWDNYKEHETRTVWQIVEQLVTHEQGGGRSYHSAILTTISGKTGWKWVKVPVFTSPEKAEKYILENMSGSKYDIQELRLI